MYLLYVDHSGEILNPNDEHYFVMGGIAVFERQVFYLEHSLEMLQESLKKSGVGGLTETDDVEFHASVMHARRGFWKRVPKKQIIGLMKDIYQTIATSHPVGVALFGVAIEKVSLIPDFRSQAYSLTKAKRDLRERLRQSQGPMAREVRQQLETVNHQIQNLIAPILDFAFERLSTAFEFFLSRFFYDPAREQQRGIMIFDHASYEDKLALLMRSFRRYGTKATPVRNIIDAPFFASSHTSRMLQLADFISYALFRRYEFGDATAFDQIAARFDQARGVFHGLVHYTKDSRCLCPACLSRRQRGG